MPSQGDLQINSRILDSTNDQNVRVNLQAASPALQLPILPFRVGDVVAAQKWLSLYPVTLRLGIEPLAYIAVVV